MLHGLAAEHRLILEVAALLHDIGHFVNAIDHHKHSQYLLMASPLIGLTEDQISIVANTARYHRKSTPKPQHDSYRVLSSHNRVIVTKLAAILRLADALDNEHASKVQSVTVDVRKAVVVLRMQGAGDLLLEKWALMKKAPMFEEVYSVSLRAGD
jgi:exopolyphosphatase/guanosine-5'-triphosphate,3'-diphosphate pyrophosphatase